jgi:hypothetical protein
MPAIGKTVPFVREDEGSAPTLLRAGRGAHRIEVDEPGDVGGGGNRERADETESGKGARYEAVVRGDRRSHRRVLP